METAASSSLLGKWRTPSNEWEQLTEDNIFEIFITGFYDPDSFHLKRHNLTKTYETFWTKFATSSYSENSGKLPNSSLASNDLRSLARIVARGWKDERYLPTVLATPFLRCCIFYEQQQLDNVIIQEFNEVLNGLSITFEEFKFVTEERAIFLEEQDQVSPQSSSSASAVRAYDDLKGSEKMLPHKLWTTFFFKWNDDKVKFYFKLIYKGSRFQCPACGIVEKKHILGTALSTDDCEIMKAMSTERRDRILNMIIDEFNQAKNKEGTFCYANDWKSLEINDDSVMRKTGYYYKWPNDLQMQARRYEVHYFLEYSEETKIIMIIKVSIRWEYWAKLQLYKKPLQHKKENLFWKYIEKIRQINEYEVKIVDIQMPCRGALCKDLYELFTEDFRMDHGEASKKMENISKEVIRFPYEYYTSRHL